MDHPDFLDWLQSLTWNQDYIASKIPDMIDVVIDTALSTDANTGPKQARLAAAVRVLAYAGYSSKKPGVMEDLGPTKVKPSMGDIPDPAKAAEKALENINDPAELAKYANGEKKR